MGWDGEQSYFMSVTAEQAAALVAMAEACFGKPRGPSHKGLTSRIFCGTYRTVEENWVAEITRGRSPRDAGYPHRIVMTPEGAHTMQQLLEVAPRELPAQQLVGVVFPFGYHGDYTFQPLSFVFALDPLPRWPDRPWRLVTAVPFLPSWLDAEHPGYGREDASKEFWDMGLLHYLGDSYWPEVQTIQSSVVVGIRDGCHIRLRKRFPDWVTAFVYFAQHQLQIECESEPDVTESLENDYPRSWELEFQAERCFDTDPGRIEYWQQALGIHESGAAST